MARITDAQTTGAYVRTGSGPHALLFVHGFLDAAQVWDGVEAALTAQGVEKVKMDLPGMGARAAAEGPITLQRYAEEVGSVVEALDKPVVIVGQSMGAQVAELAALARPGKIAGLVLLTPVPLGGLHAPEEVVAPFKALGGAPEAQRRQRAGLSANLSAGDLERLGGFGDLVAPATVAALVDAWNQGDPSGDASSAFDGPVLVIRGAADPFVNETLAGVVAARFANVREATVDNAGHWPHVEQPKAVAALIDSFIAGIDWTPRATDGTPSRTRAASDWRDAFANKSADTFAEALATDVVLEATVLFQPIEGRESVKKVMAAASKFYEKLDFTDRAEAGPRQYLEWTAQAFGGLQFGGVTILTRDEAGAIKHIAIHHRPLGAVLEFSRRLGDSLRGVISARHFFQAPTHAAQTVRSESGQ